MDHQPEYPDDVQAPGWRSELSKRLDAVERVQDAMWNMLRDVLGRTSEGKPKIGNLGVMDYVTASGAILIPLAVVAFGYFLTR
jgi:hypothetical protein